MNKLYEICKKVREQFCIDNDCLWEEDLAGCCYDISAFLYDELITKGYDAKWIEGECYGCYHCWVECNEYILDLSVKQFERFSRKKILPFIYIRKCQASIYHEKIREMDGILC